MLAPVLWTFLKDYQRRRLLVFLNPDLDPLGASYHIAQSKIVVGSGGFFGKGWLAASQSQLNFLPMNHTDILFAVLSEQWGFEGALIVLLIYTYLVTRGFQIASESGDLFATLLAAGITCTLAIQVAINISTNRFYAALGFGAKPATYSNVQLPARVQPTPPHPQLTAVVLSSKRDAAPNLRDSQSRGLRRVSIGQPQTVGS